MEDLKNEIYHDMLLCGSFNDNIFVRDVFRDFERVLNDIGNLTLKLKY